MDILLFAIIAVFIFFKLYSALGKSENQDYKYKFNEKINKNQTDLKLVKDIEPPVISSQSLAKNLSLNNTLIKINHSQASFNELDFLKGAKAAFGYIIKNFSENNQANLKPLLDEKIYQIFIKELDLIHKKGETLEKILIKINQAEIIEASLVDNVASIKVKFVSEQINTKKNKDNIIIQGDESRIEQITDEWSFSKDLTNNNPNWLLVSTN